MLHQLCRITAALAVLFAVAGPAGASTRDFPFTYDWQPPFRGEREVAYHLGYFENGRAWKHALELEYGVTERFSVAPYILFNSEGSGGLRYDAVLLETRYSFGTRADGRWLPGLYLELERPGTGNAEVEGKIILTRYGASGEDLSANYIVGLALGRGEQANHSWSVAYARSMGGAAKVGIEAIHDISGGRLNVGPTLAGPVGGAWLTGGIALPVSRANGNRTEFRLIASYHWL